jgi:glycosyltransferase involved in cell wall biosynthesis
VELTDYPPLCNSMKKFDRSVSLLCWAYNEEQLIEKYLVRINTLLDKTIEDYEIIVVDDCSTDRTNEIVMLLKEKNSRIRLIRNSENLNIGLSFRKAIMNASKEYLFWQTIDWSYDISLLRVFLEFLKSYYVVAGVRRAPVIAADRIAIIKPVLGLLKLFGINHLTKRSDTIPKAIVSIKGC